MAIPSLAMIPSGYKDGKVYSVLPNSGDGDFTFSRGSNATRVNKDGLIETMPLELGSELVTNGDFITTPTEWINYNTGSWSYDGVNDYMVNDGVSSTQIYQSISAVTGKSYKVTVEVVSGSGCTLGIGAANTTVSLSVGTNVFHITATGALFYIKRSISAITISSISIKEVTSGLDTPRLDYSDSSCPSLLLEPQSTNFITYSEELNDSEWLTTRLDVLANQIISPDGTLNADLLTPTASANSHSIGNTTLINYNSQESTISFFAKFNGYNISTSIAGTPTNWTGCIFDLENGVAKTPQKAGTQSLCTSKIENYGNGWYRCSITFTPYASGTFYNFWSTVDSTDTNLGSFGMQSYTSDGISGLYLWGIQAEQGSYPTSYIPTNGATATRLAEVCTDAGTSDTFNDSEGVLMVEAATLVESLTQNHIISIHDGTANNRVRIYWREDVPSQLIFSVFNGGALIYTYTITSIALDDMNKVCLRYGSNNFSAWVNGFKLDEQTSGGSLSLQLNTLDFNNVSGASGNAFQGNTKQIQYYNSALTDSEIEEISSWESFLDMANGQNYTIK